MVGHREVWPIGLDQRRQTRQDLFPRLLIVWVVVVVIVLVVGFVFVLTVLVVGVVSGLAGDRGGQPRQLLEEGDGVRRVPKHARCQCEIIDGYVFATCVEKVRMNEAERVVEGGVGDGLCLTG